MRDRTSCSSVLSILLFMILLAGPFFYAPVAGHGESNSIIAQFADSYTMPLPAVPLPSPAQLAPVSGVLRVLVIAATFSDVNNTKSTDEIKQEYFGTVANYYKEISYGAVSLQGDVVGWYRLNYSMVYYGRDCTRIDDSDCSGSPTSWWFARDAAAIAGKYVNFSNYDYYVFVHSGVGEESTGSKNKDNVWSVSYLGGVWLRTSDKSIDKFDIVPELEAGGAVPVGVYTHEFGHLLGLPDLYNTSTGQTIMGPWSLMDKGLWNGDPPGSSPAHMEAWSKMKLGWFNGSLLALANDGAIANYTVDATEVASNAVHVIKIPVSSTSPPTQYYLVEVREQVGFDKGLPSSGVLITYVDEKAFSKKVSVIDAHPGVPGLTNATWQVGQVFTDQKNNIGVAINGQVGNSFQVTVNRLGPIADLSVTKVFAQPADVSPNTTVTVFIDIANLGTVGGSNIPVQIFLDGQPFANQQVTLGPGQTTEISLTWVAVAGSHVFRVVVDPSNTLTELSKANNVANFTLNVGPTLIITVPLDNSTGNAAAWVRVNGVEYPVNASGHVRTTVPPGPITVEVESSIYSSNSSREVFARWSDGDSQNPRQLNVTGDISLNALFKPQYLLTVIRNGGTTTEGGWFDANTTLTVAATSPSNVTEQASRMLFTNWSGDINSNSTTLSVGLTRPMTLKADWKFQYYLNIVSPLGSPSGSGWYDAGTPATISVQSPIDLQNDTRQMFTGWNGGTSAQDTTQTIVVSAPTVVQASWKTQYLVQILTPYGNPQGSGWHDAGTQLQISVPPEVDQGNRTRRSFSGWSGDYSGKDASFPLTVNGPKTLMAEWTTQYELTFKITGIPNSTSLKLDIENSYHDISVNNGYQDWFNEGGQIEPSTNQTLIQGFTQFQFQGWRNSTGTRVSPPFTVTGPMDYTAIYQQGFPLLAIPGFSFESILLGLVMGAIAIGLLRRRKLTSR